MEQFKLTAEEVAALRGMTPQIQAAKDTIDRLERIGVPVDELRERYETARKIRDGLLSEFSPTGVPRQP